MENNKRYERANKRVEELQLFNKHLKVYISINLAIFIINMITSLSVWVIYPLLAWAIGLIIHFTVVLLRSKSDSTSETIK